MRGMDRVLHAQAGWCSVTITLDTPMLGPMDVTRDRLVDQFRGHAYDDATVARFADALIAHTGRFGLRASIIAAQIAKETGFFHYGGQVKANQFNLAGLGSTNDGAAGLHYPDIETGVAAVCAHHMTYIFGDTANWPPALQQFVALDLRHDAVLSTGQGGKVRLLGDYTNGRWAFTSGIAVGSLANGYAAGIAQLANQFTTGDSGTQGGTMLRIIVAAGHENIGKITDDKGVDGDLLSHDTGALGEPAWTVAWSHALTNLLTAAGVNAVRTDSIFHQDVFGQDADLVIVGHCDGVNPLIPQHCMAATVHRGPSTTAADSHADNFITNWRNIYPTKVGIPANGPITNDMTQEYEGEYRTANTPMVLIEHCIIGSANGVRTDAPTPEQGAAADFAAVAMTLKLATTHVIDGTPVGEGFWQIYNTVNDVTDARHRIFGKLVKGEHDAVLTKTDGTKIPVTAATFERLTLIWDRGVTQPPEDVRVPLVGETVTAA
jgi:hypothetical protein